MIITVPFSKYDNCLLKEGQVVDFEDPFLQKKVEEEVSISISKKLNVAPQKIFHYVKKFVGENIEKNELIATSKGFFSTKEIISKYSGLIKEINHSDGTIKVLSRTEAENTLLSFFKGKVNKVKEDDLSVDIGKGEQVPGKNIEINFGGKIFLYENNSEFNSENVMGSIVVCEDVSPYYKAKAEALGCHGFLSLTKIEPDSDAPIAQFKNINDFKKITKSKFTYCTLLTSSSSIYFYS